MSQVKVFEQEVAGRKLKVEIGKLAGQAHGSCTVQYGDTVILATAVQAAKQREGIDFFPLMVDYEERFYAAGKIKASRFIKREGRPSDDAVLTGRLIDRSLRPLFSETERRDVQVMITVLSVDHENDPDVLALWGASLALGMSPINWNGPVAAARVGRINGEWVLNPSYEARAKSDLEVFVSGTAEQVVMIEAAGQEIPEDIMTEAILFGQKHLGKLIPFFNEVIKECGQPKSVAAPANEEEVAIVNKIKAKVEAYLNGKFDSLFAAKSKDEYKTILSQITGGLDESLKADNEISKEERAKGLKMVDIYLDAAARDLVLNKGKRVDGRGLEELRSISAEVGVLPRTHGTGLFQRGETQVMSVVTLGAPGMEQTLDGMEEEGKKRYMHHYNFPGYSVGEVSPVRSTGRREIGHGALAEKALMPVIPQDKEKFPYTIRVVSEVLGSNGSSSQASACGSSLALMDAGVPIKAPVAGIAMGLITDLKDPSRYAILTDIQGIEDHAGDMDFKVAGTREGITAIQLDIKLNGIPQSVVGETLKRAREARVKILDIMEKAIAAPRPELSKWAPRIVSFMIPVDRIRDVIGPGGKMINEIIDATGVTIDIEDSGLVMVTSVSSEASDKAIAWIKNLTREVKPGEVFMGKVTRLMNFGAFVEVLPKQEGLVHISELAWERVGSVEDVVKVGDTLEVKVIEIDDQGRINLSHKAVLPKPEGLPDVMPREDFRPRRNGNGHGNGGGFDRNRRNNRY